MGPLWEDQGCPSATLRAPEEGRTITEKLQKLPHQCEWVQLASRYFQSDFENIHARERQKVTTITYSKQQRTKITSFNPLS